MSNYATTAVELANSALKRILVQGDDDSLDPSDYADFYRSMNNFMAAQEACGTILGYTPVTQGADPITVPAGAVMGIVANVAINVASDYNGTVSQSLVSEARMGLRAMRKLGYRRGQTSFPSNLPIGSGNDGFSVRSQTLYGRTSSGLLSLANNTIYQTVGALGAGAVNWGKVAGFWGIERYQGLQPDITGRVLNVREYAVTVTTTLKASFFRTGTSAIKIGIVKNGEIPPDIAATEILASSEAEGTIADVSISQSHTLEPGEYLEVWVKNMSDQERQVTCVNAQWRVG
mgnify:CR=1 FL=1|tara:strand:+ start:578 stop:1444 length:867 start_codon:yes stop_codon:yes gene_type:complete